MQAGVLLLKEFILNFQTEGYNASAVGEQLSSEYHANFYIQYLSKLLRTSNDVGSKFKTAHNSIPNTAGPEHFFFSRFLFCLL